MTPSGSSSAIIKAAAVSAVTQEIADAGRGSLSQGPRLPDSPFRVLLGFCPRHRAACFVGPQPRRQAAAHGDGLRTMLESAEPALSTCVAERTGESESPAGGVAVHFATGRGLVGAVGSDDQNGIGVSRELRSEVFRCAAAALSRLCAPSSGRGVELHNGS